jgi:phosphatidylinositol-bisphosphatase
MAKLIVDVRHQALLFAQGNDRAAAWEEALFRGLGDRASEFEKVGQLLKVCTDVQLAFSQYVGVMAIVLVRKTLRPMVSRVETSEKGIGLMGFVVSHACHVPYASADHCRATKQ